MSNKTRKKQVQNQAQDGRSMVEMLGVLAIIGVLSIGGISGYRMAMNRYQANQIANEINLMRTDAKIKVARGVDELLLGEPYDGDDGHLNFGSNYGVKVKFEEIETDTPGEIEKGYSFTLSNIPEGVCKPLVALLDNMDDTADITIDGQSYYDENASEDFCGETNKVMVAFSTKEIGGVSGNPEEPEPECNDETCLGGTCNEGVCKCNDPTEYWTGYGCTACPAGAWQADGTCKCTGEGSHLKGSACITCPDEAPWSDAADDCVCTDTSKSWSSDGKCIDNVCNNGEGCTDDADGNPQYCDMDSISCNNGVPSASSGTCTPVTDSSYSVKTATNSAGGKKTIYVSKSNSLDWWAADAFCQALGRKLGKPIHLVSVGDLGCPKGSFCTKGSYGNSLAPRSGVGVGWSSTLYPSDSCNVYVFNLAYGNLDIGQGYVGYDTRYNNANRHALCE